MKLAVWFPVVRTGTGTDIFTENLVAGLTALGIHAEITWLPLRAEYAPLTVAVPRAPKWATVVHVNTWLHPRFIPKHLPVVATLHHSIHDPALQAYKGRLRAVYHRRWVAPIERQVLGRADTVVAVSRFVAEMARETLCDVPMQVIYNGVDSDIYCRGKEERRVAVPFRILFVGSWMARKGVDMLMPIMRELGVDFTLLYTGGSAVKGKAHMPTNMHDIGRLSVSQVVGVMQGADAFLFPSRSEGLPLAAIEAMACGLPVVAARASSLPEVVEDGVTGLLCPRDDCNAFAEALRSLADSPDLARAMGAAASMAVERRFSLKAMISAYVDAYRGVTGIEI